MIRWTYSKKTNTHSAFVAFDVGEINLEIKPKNSGFELNYRNTDNELRFLGKADDVEGLKKLAQDIYE